MPLSSSPLQRFAPLLLFVSAVLLLFSIYLFARSASARLSLQNLQKQHYQLLDQKRLLQGQVDQLQAEHRQKESLVKLAQSKLSLGEEQQLEAELESTRLQEQFARQKTRAAELEVAFRKTVSSQQAEFLFQDRNLIIRFYEPTLFGPGEISLGPNGTKLLQLVGQSLQRDFPLSPVRIEGHSDNAAVPGGIRSRFPSNWELSSYRAAAVARALQDNSKVDPLRLSPQGFAATRPVESNDSKEGRAKNRRIDLVISLQSPPASAETSDSSTP